MFACKLSEDAQLQPLEPQDSEELNDLSDSNRGPLCSWVMFLENVASNGNALFWYYVRSLLW